MAIAKLFALYTNAKKSIETKLRYNNKKLSIIIVYEMYNQNQEIKKQKNKIKQLQNNLNQLKSNSKELNS